MQFSLSLSPRGSRSHSAVSAGLFALAIVLSALLLGALHTTVLSGIAALLAVAAFVGWFPGSPLRPRLPATILLLTGIFLTGFTALQAVALPASIVRSLSPASAEVWAGALAPLQEPGPAWTTLSLEPTATRIQVLRGVAYITAFLVALRVVERRRGTRFLSMVIIATALILATSALLHPIFGAQRVFGVYKPVQVANERHIAPLLNANHLAAYLNIGFCLALGLAVDRRAERYRPIAVAVAMLLAATQMWVASRGGVVAMLFGAACVFVMARVSRQFVAPSSSSVALPALVIAASIAMTVLGSASDAALEINSIDSTKIRIAISGLPLALRYPLFGVGRGAFEVAFPSVRKDDLGYIDFTHPENLLVQWLTEWGIPATLLGFVALGTALRPKVLTVSSSPAIGAWSAIVTTSLHNLVDFNSEVPAIGIAIAACAAMVVGGRGNLRTAWIHQWSASPRAVAATLGVATLLSIAVALERWPHELSQDRTALYAEATRPAPRDDFVETARQALLRHPSEPYIPFIAAVDASRRGRSVIPWVERTLALAQSYGPAHFILAEQLEREGPAQARLEYRLAMTQQPPLSSQVLLRAAPLIRSFDDALELAPSNATRVTVLGSIADAVGARLPATRERLTEMVRSLDPNASGPLSQTVSDVQADLEAKDAAPWCEDRKECLQPGLVAVKRLSALRPGQCGPSILRARLELAADEEASALQDLQIEAQSAVNPSECWQALGELALAAKNEAYVTAAEEAMTRSGCGADAECANQLLWAASLEERRGNVRRAMVYYERARKKAPERADLVERVAQLASQLGLHAEALEAYQKLARMSPNAERWRLLADREKTQLFHEVAP